MRASSATRAAALPEAGIDGPQQDFPLLMLLV